MCMCVCVFDATPTPSTAISIGDNPLSVAQKWLEDQGLPETYREQVVEFLVQNTGGSSRPSAQADLYQNVDPFTGGGAYQPGGGSGGGKVASQSRLRHIPKSGMIYYETVPVANLRKKIVEFWVDVNGGSEGLDADERCLDQLLEGMGDNPPHGGASKADPASYEFLGRILQWPQEKLFPCIDIVRMLVLSTDGAEFFAKDEGRRLLQKIISSAFVPDASVPTKLVTLKLLCNCFRHRKLLESVSSDFGDIMNNFSSMAEAPNKHVRLALSNLIVNLSVFCSDGANFPPVGGGQEALSFQCASLAVEMLKHSIADDVEPTFRALVCVGTLAVKVSKDMIRALDVKNLAAQYAGSGGKVSEAASDVSSLL